MHPLPRKQRSRRKKVQEDEKIIKKFTAVIRGGMNTSSRDNDSSGVLVFVLKKFTAVIIASIET